MTVQERGPVALGEHAEHQQRHAADAEQQGGNEGGERDHLLTMAMAVCGARAATCACTMAATGASKICVKLLG